MIPADLDARLPRDLSLADLQAAADMFNLAGNSERLKIIYLLWTMQQLSVLTLAQELGIGVDAVKAHLDALRGAGLVDVREEAGDAYARLTDDNFNGSVLDYLAQASAR